jgi:hypothetical protein
MKRFSYTHAMFGLLLLFALGLSSCSKSTNPLDLVNKDAKMVLILDSKSLIDKSKFADFKKTAAYSKIKLALMAENEKLEKLFEELIENPMITGVDITKKIVFYGNGGNDYNIIFENASSSKFEEFVEHVRKEFEIKESPEKLKNCKILNVGFGSALAWTGNIGAIINYPDGNIDLKDEKCKSYFEGFFEPKPENSILQNKDFTAFHAGKYDIGLWLAIDKYLNEQPQFKLIFSTLPFDLKNTYVAVSFEFGKDEIVANTDFIMNEEMKKKYPYEKYVKTGINEKMLSMLPKDKALAVLAYALNAEEYGKVVFEVLESPFFKENAKDIPLDKIHKFFDIINGDILLSFNGLTVSTKAGANESEEVMPLFSIAIGLKDQSKADELISELLGEKCKKTAEGYAIDAGDFKIGMIVKDGFIFASNDPLTLAFAQNGAASESFAATSFGETFKKTAIGEYINLNYSTYPETVKEKIRGLFNTPEEFNAFMLIADVLDYGIATDLKSSKGVAKLKMRNANENSLFTIIDAIDKIIAKSSVF